MKIIVFSWAFRQSSIIDYDVVGYVSSNFSKQQARQVTDNSSSTLFRLYVYSHPVFGLSFSVLYSSSVSRLLSSKFLPVLYEPHRFVCLGE